MTKIEDAAHEYLNALRHKPIRFDIFVAGARWALEQLADENLIDIAAHASLFAVSENLRIHKAGDAREPWLTAARAALAQAREEIEK